MNSNRINNLNDCEYNWHIQKQKQRKIGSAGIEMTKQKKNFQVPDNDVMTTMMIRTNDWSKMVGNTHTHTHTKRLSL